jgi:hypothetical protein
VRTSPNLTEVEIAAFTKFAVDHEIITDGETGVRNADILCGPIIEADSDITAATMQASFAKVRSQLKLKSATYKKADELARKLSPEEQATYKAWADGQKLLVGLDGSEEGYQNVASLLSWMRGNSLTAHSLDLALGNIINNPKVGQRIHFHPQPKQKDRSVVQGRANHAFNQEEPKPKAAAGIQQKEFVGGRRNHGYIPPEEVQKKVATEAVPDAWQEICRLHLKEWVTPGQRAKLEAEYNSGVASGKGWREIGTALGALVRDQHRGR